MFTSKPKRSALLLTIAAVLLLFVPVRAAEIVPSEEITGSRYEYEIEAAKTGDFDIPVSFGNAHFLKQKKVVTYHGPEMQILEICVSRLDEVKEGDVLIRLCPAQDPLDTEEKKRTLQRAEESFERSCRDYERRLVRDQEALNKINDSAQLTLGILQHQLLEAEYDKFKLETAHTLKKQRAEVEALEETVEILSPAAGTINSVVKSADGMLKEGSEIAVIYGAPRSTIVISQSKEERTGRVHFASGAYCTSDIGVTEGFVTASSFIPEMSNSESAGGGWSVVVLDPDAETRKEIEKGTNPGRLFDQMVYRERVVENVLRVPASAVSSEVQRGGKEVFFVTVQSEEGLLNRRNVQVLNEYADYMWVIAGLEEGERVVVRERSY